MEFALSALYLFVFLLVGLWFVVRVVPAYFKWVSEQLERQEEDGWWRPRIERRD